MKRFIVHKAAIDILGISSKSAINELSQAKLIHSETLHFDNVPYISVVLSNEQVELLRSHNIEVREEFVQSNVTLGADYEKIRSLYHKTKKKALSGKGVKVAVLDSGCNTAIVPVNYQANVIDANPGITDILGHGTRVCSIINHPIIGISNGCEFHMIKTVADNNSITEAAALAAFDYVIANNIDVVNLSWTYFTTALQEAINAAIANNTIVCAASGNSSFVNDTYAPACLPGVVAINAIQENGEPSYKNINAPDYYVNSHGITVACSGVATEGYNTSGVYSSGWGTSFACPFFVGAFALYKEELEESNNSKVLEYILKRTSKTLQPEYFGSGIVSF
jgi:Subtilisin-like serine proteases